MQAITIKLLFMSLQINKAKPNPAGKDRLAGAFIPAAQIAGEWVDVRNIAKTTISLQGVELYHYAYLQGGKEEWQIVLNLGNVLRTLPMGTVLRIHSGGEIPLTQMYPVDRIGADYHAFSGKGYVWNNRQPDFPGLWFSSQKVWIDNTSYDAYPGEGRILNRIGNKLI